MEAFSFGSYYPGDSAIHRVDPRTKLLLGFVFLITTLTVSSFRGLVPVAIFVAARLFADKRGLAAFRRLYGVPPDLDDGRHERHHAHHTDPRPHRGL